MVDETGVDEMSIRQTGIRRTGTNPPGQLPIEVEMWQLFESMWGQEVYHFIEVSLFKEFSTSMYHFKHNLVINHRNIIEVELVTDDDHSTQHPVKPSSCRSWVSVHGWTFQTCPCLFHQIWGVQLSWLFISCSTSNWTLETIISYWWISVHFKLCIVLYLYIFKKVDFVEVDLMGTWSGGSWPHGSWPCGSWSRGRVVLCSQTARESGYVRLVGGYHFGHLFCVLDMSSSRSVYNLNQSV